MGLTRKGFHVLLLLGVLVTVMVANMSLSQAHAKAPPIAVAALANHEALAVDSYFERFTTGAPNSGQLDAAFTMYSYNSTTDDEGLTGSTSRTMSMMTRARAGNYARGTSTRRSTDGRPIT